MSKSKKPFNNYNLTFEGNTKPYQRCVTCKQEGHTYLACGAIQRRSNPLRSILEGLKPLCSTCKGTGRVGRKTLNGLPHNLHGGVPAEVLNALNATITKGDCPNCKSKLDQAEKALTAYVEEEKAKAVEDFKEAFRDDYYKHNPSEHPDFEKELLKGLQKGKQ